MFADIVVLYLFIIYLKIYLSFLIHFNSSSLEHFSSLVSYSAVWRIIQTPFSIIWRRLREGEGILEMFFNLFAKQLFWWLWPSFVSARFNFFFWCGELCLKHFLRFLSFYLKDFTLCFSLTPAWWHLFYSLLHTCCVVYRTPPTLGDFDDSHNF